jgi:hypothetical protein
MQVIKLIVLILSIDAYSQTDYLNQLIPPPVTSPTAGELGKYGAWPVSYYRGTPEISIPIASYDVDGFTLPISLSYHASGIKVNDIASWVGLGWTLNAGGAISITIKGRSDFELFDVVGNPTPRLHKSKQDIINKDFFTRSEFDLLVSNNRDAEPDIYSYNFGEYSGQFITDHNGTIHFLKNNNGLIFSINYITQIITAIDNKGIMYIFRDKETTISYPYTMRYDAYNNIAYNNYSNQLEIKNSITALYLSEIVFPNNGGYINFIYIDEQSKTATEVNGSMNTTTSNSEKPCHTYIPYWREQGEHTFVYHRNTINSKRLYSISNSVNNNRIDFEAINERDDLKGTNRLDRITIINDGTPQVYFDLFTDYFVSNLTSSDYNGNSINKRLRLSSVVRPPINWTKLHDIYKFI